MRGAVDAIESNINFDFYGAMAWQGWSCTRAPRAVSRVPRGGGATLFVWPRDADVCADPRLANETEYDPDTMWNAAADFVNARENAKFDVESYSIRSNPPGWVADAYRQPGTWVVMAGKLWRQCWRCGLHWLTAVGPLHKRSQDSTFHRLAGV